MTKKLFLRLGFYSALVLTAQASNAQNWSLEEIRDRMMIEETMNRYLYALDTVDPEAYAATFTPNGSLIVRETLAEDDYEEQGRDAIREYAEYLREEWDMKPVEQGGDRFGPLRHVYYNFVINDITETTAFAETYWTTRARNPEGGPAIIASMGRSEDHFRKVNGQWLFEKRIIIVDMDVPLE